jgi:hypothetical protein
MQCCCTWYVFATLQVVTGSQELTALPVCPQHFRVDVSLAAPRLASLEPHLEGQISQASGLIDITL